MFDTPFWLCCVILSKETLASARVMNHVHSVTFFHRYIVSVDNRFPKSYLLWKRGQSISTETVMLFTEEHFNKIFQAHRFLYCDKRLENIENYQYFLSRYWNHYLKMCKSEQKFWPLHFTFKLLFSPHDLSASSFHFPLFFYNYCYENHSANKTK
jgi:hypothetical protein